ncbi:MAG: DUF6146 family protein [Marinirhabdus sp.]|nr:DUF6146 family protein [Marinirhabdus sp.]
MKQLCYIVLLAFAFAQCTATKDSSMGSTDGAISEEAESVRIANDSLEYEIIITDIGFPRFLNTQPPESYYSIGYLERRNQFFVAEYNRRVLDIRYSRDLYPQRIEYDITVDYGKEVNYLLFQYFRYFAREYNQDFQGIRN